MRARSCSCAAARPIAPAKFRIRCPIPRGAEQAVWIVPAAGGGEPKKLGEGSAPEVSKSGRVAWISKGPGLVRARRRERQGRASFSKCAAQPRRCAGLPMATISRFVSERGDHSFVGVYRSVTAKSLRFLAPTVDSDSEPAWSPDGKQIAFLRLPAGANRILFAPVRAGDPWSIHMADVATGESRLVFAAEAGRGSVFHAMTAPNQVLWASSGHLVFPWERDGWLHLYSVSVTGRRGRTAAAHLWRIRSGRRAPHRRRPRGSVLIQQRRHRPPPSVSRARRRGRGDAGHVRARASSGRP